MNVGSYQVVGELELEKRYDFSRDVVPGKTGVARELPRLDHIGIVLMKDSIAPVN